MKIHKGQVQVSPLPRGQAAGGQSRDIRPPACLQGLQGPEAGPGSRASVGRQGDIFKESNSEKDGSGEAAQTVECYIVICDRHWSQGTVSHQ